MGKPKQSLPFGESTIAATVSRTLLDAGLAGVVVVTRSCLIDRLQLPDDPRVHVAFNEDTESEMIDSIRIGLSTIEPLGPGKHDGVLVAPADMPNLSATSCRACVKEFILNPQRVVVATFEGRPAHPMVFPLALRDTVNGLDGGLRMLPQTCPDLVSHVEINDPGGKFDVDTAEDYERL